MGVTRTAAVLWVMGLIARAVVAGYYVSFIAYPPQISQLQSDLFEKQSTLLRSQSERALRLSITRSVDRYMYRRLQKCPKYVSIGP